MGEASTSPDFLTDEDVLRLHATLIGEFGGERAVRDLGLLKSAVAQPRATFGGEYLHGDLFHMAAAYLFHIAKNHAFVDGNKRTALLATLTFLSINDVELAVASSRLYDLTMSVTQGKVDKEAAAETLRGFAKPPRSRRVKEEIKGRRKPARAGR